MNVLDTIGRSDELFQKDIDDYSSDLLSLVEGSKFLVIGGAGSIGQAVTKEIFARDPKALHVVDISENNMVELVRDLRSTVGYIDGDFRTFIIDSGSPEFDLFVEEEGPYDYVLNLSALKHVRSERDRFTLMRMVDTNILNTLKSVGLARGVGAKKYFCVSTDKAANPVNLMGASKRIMEMLLMRESISQKISTARFANVAFSDGSLLHGFKQRFEKFQPLSAPKDVRRYFLTSKESGQLCLMSCLLGDNRDVLFPKLSESKHLITFQEIAGRFLRQLGYEPYECSSEDEARLRIDELVNKQKWPCYFFGTDTTGEKGFEEFYTESEELDLERFYTIGIVRHSAVFDEENLDAFIDGVESLRLQSRWTKKQVVDLFERCIPEFKYVDVGRNLDQKM